MAKKIPWFCACSLVLASGVALACSGSAPAGQAVPQTIAPVGDGACEVVGTAGDSAGEVRVLFDRRVDPRRAPIPANDAERVTFLLLYPGLLAMNCEGRVVADLARSWEEQAGGRAWTFRLDEGRHFSDGVPLTAWSVVEAWRLRATMDSASDVWKAIDLSSTRATGPHTLRVESANGVRLDSSFFTLPQLRVARRESNSWPVGAGPYAIDTLPGVRTTIRMSPMSAVGPPIVVQVLAGRDPRELLELGASAMVTRDPVALSFAAARGGFEIVPLRWNRAYVLLNRIPGGHGSEDDSVQTDDLAREVVRGEARIVTGPQWWDDLDACGEAPAAAATSSPTGGAPPPPTLAYDRDDDVARALAERLVALARSRGPGLVEPGRLVAWAARGFGTGGEAPRTAALSAGVLARELTAGSHAAYVIPLPLRAVSPCLERGVLLRRAPWLASDPLAASMVPLVETRLSLIMRLDAIRAQPTWDGSVRLFP
jgi:Bacterial extracellular solute-binding proteins, family 5 Middle